MYYLEDPHNWCRVYLITKVCDPPLPDDLLINLHPFHFFHRICWLEACVHTQIHLQTLNRVAIVRGMESEDGREVQKGAFDCCF